jgi:hypothetical protein
MTPFSTPANFTHSNKYEFKCHICEDPSLLICAYCTKDCCDLHCCDRCRRCSDCCVCYQDQQTRR